jgi:Rieske 2Fe-2S family protein
MTHFRSAVEIGTGGAFTLPGRYYTSPEILREEHERIFGRRWLCAGREEQIAAPGEYLVRTIGADSVIVLRDHGGAVRAFHNVCRHRGTRMCEEHRGRFSKTIQCPYHAWTYALDGRLVGAPSMDGVEDFDRDAYPLHPVATALWEGFVFISLAERPEPFEEAYAPLIGRFARWGLPSLRSLRRIEYDVRANWKLIVQNYSECYHCSPVHPQLVKLTPAQSGENDLTSGPFLGGYMTIVRPGGSMTMTGAACGLPVGDLPPEDLQRVYYYSLFPNVLLSLHHDYVMAHTLWPEAPDRTRIECEWLFHPETASRPELDPDDGVRFWDLTNGQDWHVCELSQLGVSSRAYTPGPYSPREAISVAFDREWLRAMGLPEPRPAGGRAGA